MREREREVFIQYPYTIFVFPKENH